MEQYNRVMSELNAVYETHVNNNTETRHVSGINDVSLKTMYDNTIIKIDEEKKSYSDNKGIYKYLSNKDDKFVSNILEHLNYFKKSTQNIMPQTTLNEIYEYERYQKEQYFNEKKRKHSELLRGDNAVFIASDDVIKDIKTKKRYLF